MKKILLSSLIVSSSILFAGDSEDFYYDRGYENGYQKGLLKGQEEAFKDAKKILSAYKDRIKAYEIGKYLIHEKKLTAPQVYQQLDSDGSMKIVVVPSKIQRELNIEDIFKEFDSLPTLYHKQVNSTTKESDLNEKNSVYLSNRDTYSEILPDKVDKNFKKSTLKVKKSSKNRNLLNNANIAYVENKYNYEVIFFTKQEKKNFCVQFTSFCR